MSILQVWIPQLRKLQGEELRPLLLDEKHLFAQPNINTVKNIDMFFSDLLPLELLRMKGQVHPWCKAICFGFCWEWICCTDSTAPVAKTVGAREGNHLHPATGTNQRLLHTQVTQHQGRQQTSVPRTTASWAPHHSTPTGAPGFNRAVWGAVHRAVTAAARPHSTLSAQKLLNPFTSTWLHTQLVWFSASTVSVQWLSDHFRLCVLS